VKRVKTCLTLLTVGTALALALAPAASAAPASPGTDADAATIALALVPASATPVVVKKNAGASTNADQDGACNSLTNGDGDFCLWFSTNFVGSLCDRFTSDTNLADNTFLTPGLGLGQSVTNDSESSLDADTRLSVVVFTGASFSGAAGLVQPRQFGNFNPTFANNVESFRFQ
jgi:hypothetical protein